LLYVDRRGCGSRLIILGGGPGFSHSYLIPALAPLEQDFELIYVDYPGCGKSRATTGAASFADITSAVVEALGAHVNSDPVDFLCHSFGVAMLGAMLHARAPIRVRKCVFANPSPHSRDLCDKAESALFSRLSAEDAAFLQKALMGGDSQTDTIMDRLFPYYCGRNHDLPDVHVELFVDAYFAASNTAGRFDLTEAIASIPKRLYLFGSNDFIGPQFFREVLDSPGVEWKTLKGGHFLAYDAAAEFCSAVKQFLSDS
jgi:pimeloyl-ACP methyl ester carboxylesterase